MLQSLVRSLFDHSYIQSSLIHFFIHIVLYLKHPNRCCNRRSYLSLLDLLSESLEQFEQNFPSCSTSVAFSSPLSSSSSPPPSSARRIPPLPLQRHASSSSVRPISVWLRERISEVAVTGFV